MDIKEFVENYNKHANELKDNFFSENITIRNYIPFIEKLNLAEKLIKVTTSDKNNNCLKINSPSQYLLFCRIIIEQYTDLKIRTEGFYEEYDLLKQSGILNKIIASIPEEEIKELKMIVDMVQNDIITNNNNPYVFINNQVERFTTITGIMLKPFLETLSNKIKNLNDEQIEKILNNFLNKLSNNI